MQENSGWVTKNNNNNNKKDFGFGWKHFWQTFSEASFRDCSAEQSTVLPIFLHHPSCSHLVQSTVIPSFVHLSVSLLRVLSTNKPWLLPLISYKRSLLTSNISNKLFNYSLSITCLKPSSRISPLFLWPGLVCFYKPVYKKKIKLFTCWTFLHFWVFLGFLVLFSARRHSWILPSLPSQYLCGWV